MRTALLCSALCLSSAFAVLASDFENLGFEDAAVVTIPGRPFNQVYFELAFPAWSGFSGTNQLDWAMYDNIFLDVTHITIYDRNTNAFYNGSAVIQGSYSVVLRTGLSLYNSLAADASLSQTGLIPAGTKSLSFLAGAFGPFAVTLGGVPLNLISSPVAGQNYQLYQADISAFAGLTAELNFTLIAQNPYNNQVHAMILDDIKFSPDAIPEPSSLSLLIVGVIGLGICYSTRRKVG